MSQQIHEIQRVIGNKEPLGATIPKQYESLAQIKECTIYEIEPPISHRVKTLLHEFNSIHPNDEPLTMEDAIKKSRQWERKYLRWQAIRHMGKGFKLTGHEPFYLGDNYFGEVDSTRAITLAIAMRGLEIQRDHMRTTNRLLTVGMEGLTLHELKDVNTILGNEIKILHERMNREDRLYNPGLEFRNGVLQLIDALPDSLKTIYYYQGPQGQIVSVYALPDRILEYGPLKRTDWQDVMLLAEENGINISLERIKFGRDVIKMFSQGIDPLTRVFMT